MQLVTGGTRPSSGRSARSSTPSQGAKSTVTAPGSQDEKLKQQRRTIRSYLERGIVVGTGKVVARGNKQAKDRSRCVRGTEAGGDAGTVMRQNSVQKTSESGVGRVTSRVAHPDNDSTEIDILDNDRYDTDLESESEEGYGEDDDMIGQLTSRSGARSTMSLATPGPGTVSRLSDSSTVYLAACRKTDVIPASYFLRHMEDDALSMKHHGLGPEGMKPIAASLSGNNTVVKLNLTDNWLCAEGGKVVCEMLRENSNITELDLSHNNLGNTFVQALAQVLRSNQSITHLNLAANRFDDRGAQYISDILIDTTKVCYLNLSRNNFGEGSGRLFGLGLSENTSLHTLDLSWNTLRRKGAADFARGLKSNLYLIKLNLEWNGFAVEGSRALGESLKTNHTLEWLDISNNRITTEGAVLLGKGIGCNETLRVLKMNRNPMRSAGCYGVCSAVLRCQTTQLEEMEFLEIEVNDDFKDLLDQLHDKFPAIKVRSGSYRTQKRPKRRLHPMAKLRNYVEKHNLKLIDFFNKFDKDGSMSVTHEEFREGIDEIGIKLEEGEISQLIRDLDRDMDGEINYSEMVIGHQAVDVNPGGNTTTSKLVAWL